MLRRTASLALLVISLAALASGGCNLDVLSQKVETAAEQPQLLSVRGNTLVLANADYATGAFDDLFLNPDATPPEATFRVYSVDLVSGVVQVLEQAASAETVFGDADDAFAPGFGHGGPFSATAVQVDGPWTAKLNLREGYVSVTDSSSGTETRYLEEVGDAAQIWLLGLRQNRLLLSIQLPDRGAALLVSIDLRTGDELVMDRVAPFHDPRAVVFDGSRVAFAGIPDFDPATDDLSASLAAETLDWVDLASGRRETLTSGLGGWGTHAVFFDGDAVAWLEETDTSFVLRSVDVASRSVTTRDEFSSQDGESDRTLHAVNARAALLSDTEVTGKPSALFDIESIEDTTTVSLHHFGGPDQTLMTYTRRGLDPTYSFINVLTDDYAAVADPASNELVIYALETGVLRRTALPR
jgi:hypothetical protein